MRPATHAVGRAGGIADGLTKRGFSGYFRIVFTATSNGQLAANLAGTNNTAIGNGALSSGTGGGGKQLLSGEK